MFRTTNKSRLTLTCLDRRDVPAVMPTLAHTPVAESTSPEGETALMAATLSDKTMFVLQLEPSSEEGAAARPPRLDLGTATQEAIQLEASIDEGETLGVAKYYNPDRR